MLSISRMFSIRNNKNSLVLNITVFCTLIFVYNLFYQLFTEVDMVHINQL